MTSPEAKNRLQAEIKAYGKSKRRWYREVYLFSLHWKTLRAQKLESVGRKCADCGTSKKLQCHHLKYRSIFNVTLSDLQVLCEKCHRKEHDRIKKERRRKRKIRLRGKPF